METNEKERSAAEAVGYIAGVGCGITRRVLGGHFLWLALATAALLVAMLFIGTELALMKALISYLAVAALIFGHALLRQPPA